MIEWDRALRITGTPLYLDSRLPRPLGFVSHAHSDHIAPHDRVIATPQTAALLAHRLGSIDTLPVEVYGTANLAPGLQVALRPAGHVLGSAMLHATTDRGTLLYTGDFKLRPSATCQTADPLAADVLVMESTFGIPLFRFPPREQLVAELIERVGQALRDGRQPIVYGYSLGKAQEIVRLLGDAGFVVTEHGAVAAISRIYRSLGVPLPDTRRYVAADFHGPAALDLAERGVLVAPPQMARSGFTTNFEKPLRIMLSGWGILRNASYRYGVDHVLPISDHADFDELLELIERVKPRRIFTHHGYKEFVDHLRARGHDAALARPDAQMTLF
jgi:Cft2 family RNA processing exonuclease